jgi:hypothetical protein
MSDEGRTRWWMTLPGLLTALAAVITAVTGLVVGLTQIGVFDRSSSDPSPSVVPQDDAASIPADNPATLDDSPGAMSAGAPAYEVTLPLKEKMQSENTTYEILEYEIRPDSDDNLALSLSIRMTNQGKYPANFWDESFRLIAGQDTFAPSGGLNELVAGDSSKVGTILFVVPSTTRTAQLRVKFGADDARTIPFELRPISS